MLGCVGVMAVMLFGGLNAANNDLQNISERADTTLQFDPVSGLPIIEETNEDTMPRFDSETGLPLTQSGTHPQAPDNASKLGANESVLKDQLADERLKPAQFIDSRRFPIQFISGREILALSYRFSEEIEIKENRDIYESFSLYPALTLGFVGTSLSGIIEAHRQLEMENLRPFVFLGVGLGVSDGVGLVLSVGAQLESRRLMGGLRFYHVPGIRNFVGAANVGFQLKSNREELIIAGTGAAIYALVLVVAIIISGFAN